MTAFSENEISSRAFGGTEIAKRMLGTFLNEMYPELNLDQDFQIVCSRVRELDETKIRIFWCHDLPEDPESVKFKDPAWVSKFHKFVFISEWQYQRYQLVLGLPYSKDHIVLESAMRRYDRPEGDVGRFLARDKVGPIRICYTSTPQRGLDILLAAFEELQKEYGEFVHLDVFSSFKIYGWDAADAQFEPLYDRIRNNPGATYHGFAPHEELQNYLQLQGHIHAYPSTWLETSCRAMLEAMGHGLICVHPNLGALPDTSGRMNRFMYQGDQDKQKHLDAFYPILKEAVNLVENENPNRLDDEVCRIAEYVKRRYDLPTIADQWFLMMTHLQNAYPDVASRKIPKPGYSFST